MTPASPCRTPRAGSAEATRPRSNCPGSRPIALDDELDGVVGDGLDTVHRELGIIQGEEPVYALRPLLDERPRAHQLGGDHDAPDPGNGLVVIALRDLDLEVGALAPRHPDRLYRPSHDLPAASPTQTATFIEPARRPLSQRYERSWREPPAPRDGRHLAERRSRSLAPGRRASLDRPGRRPAAGETKGRPGRTSTRIV